MNILIPLAGSGTRFANFGYHLPKFLIPIQERPMLSWVIDSIKIEGHYIFLCRDNHVRQFELPQLFKQLTSKIHSSFEIVSDDGQSPGAATGCLKAKHQINNNKKLAIINNDQYWKYDSSDFLKFLSNKKANGAVLTFKTIDSKWSFVKTDENDLIIQVAEKQVISNRGNVGAFFYEHGSDFVWSIEQMIKDKSKMFNNEWYVAPSINELIAIGKCFYAYDVEMHGLGTPTDLQIFESKLNIGK